MNIHGRQTSTNGSSAIAVILRFLLPYKRAIAISVILVLLSAACMLAVPLLVRHLVDDAAQGAALSRSSLGALYVIAVIFAFVSALRAYSLAWFGERAAADLRVAVHRTVVQLDFEHLEAIRPGEVLSRLGSDISLVQTILSSGFVEAIRAIVSLAGSLTLLLMTSPTLTGIMLALMPVLIVPMLFLGRQVRIRSRLTQDGTANSNALAEETLSAIGTIQALSLMRHRCDQFAEAVHHSVECAMGRNRVRATMFAVTFVTFSTAVAIIIGMGLRSVDAGALSSGQLSQFLLYSMILTVAAGSLSELFGELQRAAGAMERVVELLHAKPFVTEPAKAVPFTLHGAEVISFDKVSFYYPSRKETRALDDFSLRIPRGETVALVGPSGAGKSTVFNLLMRFYAPTGGRILVEGVDIAQAGSAATRQRIGYVPQDTVLFNATVRENIRYGRMDATEEQIERAARAANALEFIAAMPDGLDTSIGERGMQLSGGQRQRIAIARAILKDAPILLLDEATSSLDSESEKQIEAALRTLTAGRTTLLIAHRLSTVLGADRIVLMNQGRIQAIGTHRELLEREPLYAHLVALQFNSEHVDLDYTRSAKYPKLTQSDLTQQTMVAD
ncbi:MAG TPA: ATP-binding cassette domain-containing protein [Steroidobacteraceae bacterium]|nr:ATP-binding cassette domain-containing protein [Steroidobacteraceae bacterium]